MSDKPESPSENKPSSTTNHPFLEGEVVGDDHVHEDYSPIKKGGSGKLIFTLLLLVALGAGGYYYMTLQKDAANEAAPIASEAPAVEEAEVANTMDEPVEAATEAAAEVVAEVSEKAAEVVADAKEQVTEVAETVGAEAKQGVANLVNDSLNDLAPNLETPAESAAETADAAAEATESGEMQWEDGKITDSAQGPPPPANPDSKITIDSTGTTLQVKAPTLSEKAKIVVSEEVEKAAKETQP